MKPISELSDRELLELLLASQAQMQLDILSIMRKVGTDAKDFMGYGNIVSQYVNMSRSFKTINESIIE